jgi:hypothetical protein
LRLDETNRDSAGGLERGGWSHYARTIGVEMALWMKDDLWPGSFNYSRISEVPFFNRMLVITGVLRMERARDGKRKDGALAHLQQGREYVLTNVSREFLAPQPPFIPHGFKMRCSRSTIAMLTCAHDMDWPRSVIGCSQ